MLQLVKFFFFFLRCRMLLTRPFAFIWAGADGTQESQGRRPLSATVLQME